MNADRSAVEAAAHAGLRSAPSMMNSTMIGMAAAIAESPSDPLIGAYTCVHIYTTLALMKLKCCASYIMFGNAPALICRGVPDGCGGGARPARATRSVRDG